MRLLVCTFGLLAAVGATLLTGCASDELVAPAQPGSPSLTVYASAATASTASPPRIEPNWATLGHDARRSGVSPHSGPSSPNCLWSADLGECYSPCIGPDGTVYTGTSAGQLVALKPDGSIKWKLRVDGGILNSPTVAPEGNIYVCTQNLYKGSGAVYAVTPEGTVAWRHRTAPLSSSPAIASDGTVLVCDGRGWLHALEPNGKEIWHYRAVGTRECYSSPAIGQDGTIYYGTTLNDSEGSGALNAVASNGLPLWRLRIGRGINGHPALASNGAIYVCSSRDGQLQAVTPAGRLLWQFTAGSRLESAPAVGEDGTVYFATDAGSVFAVKPNGQKKWELNVGEVIQTSPAIGADGTIYVLGHSLLALSPGGRLLWSTAKGDHAMRSPAIGNGVIYVPGYASIQAIGDH
jgi:outer membrane protein assembly factor BamB